MLHSENAASGLGLTLFHPGQPPVYGFTSPLGVLVPLLGDSIHVGFGLILIKLVSVLISGLAVWLGARIAWQWNLRPSFVLMVAGFLALEHHQILWGSAGMETQIAVTVLLFSAWCLLNPNPVRTGIALGLCLLARPDFALWAAIAFGTLAITTAREHRVRQLLKTALYAIAVFGPWLFFTAIYYGSPVPNTIRAKFYGYLNGAAPHPTFFQGLGAIFSHVVQVFATLGTCYGGNGTGFTPILGGLWIEAVLLWLLWIGGSASLRRRDLDSLPVILFIAAYCAYCILFVPFVFGWYSVPVAAMAILGAAYGGEKLAVALVPTSWRDRAASIFVGVYLTTFLIASFVTIPAERNVQLYVEDGVRRTIGEYLHQVTSPNDTIGCEALGYFGYYSRRSIYDFPGLANREVTEYLRTHPEKRRLDYMLDYFRPNYIVLRTGEFEEFTRNPSDAWLLKDYVLERQFSARPEAWRIMLQPEQNIDLSFLVFRRKD